MSLLAVSSGRTGVSEGCTLDACAWAATPLPRASTADRESLPWEPDEMQDAPPLVCEVCRCEIPDGAGWLTDTEHLVCPSCVVGD